MKWKFWQSTDSDLEQAEVTEGENPKSSILRVTTALIGLYLVAAIIIGVIWSRAVSYTHLTLPTSDLV